MPSLPNPLKIATKGAETAFQIGTFVAGQAFERVQSLRNGDGKDDTFSPAEPPKREDAPQERSPQPPKLESVKDADTTSTGSKPTTSSTTATGPGGTARMAPKAPATKAPAKKAPSARAKSSNGSNGSEGGSVKEITAKPSASGNKGETSTTIKSAPRTGPRSAGGRITNPKAAAKARKRNAGASAQTGAGANAGPSVGSATAAARTGDLSKAKGKGGRPATVKAENSPAELADAKTGRQPAPLGSDS